jgi:hypothetical protein
MIELTGRHFSIALQIEKCRVWLFSLIFDQGVGEIAEEIRPHLILDAASKIRTVPAVGRVTAKR